MDHFRVRVVPVVCFTLLVISSACSLRQADLTAISTRNVVLSKVDIDALPQTKGVEGQDSVFHLLFIPIPFRIPAAPHLEEAIEDALDKGKGDLMIDAVIYSKGWWFLVGQDKLTVKGTVVNTRSAAK